MPIMEYRDIVWGDKQNVTLMDKVQILQNKVAKIVLDKPMHSSATNAIQQLGWETMYKRRRHHRLIFIYNIMNGLIDWDITFIYFRDIHSYNTRIKNNLCLPKSRTSWGQCRLVHHVRAEWNSLTQNIRNASFKKHL